MSMVFPFLVVCAVVVYALWAKGDVTLNGKVGWFSFCFQAKDRKRREQKGCGASKAIEH